MTIVLTNDDGVNAPGLRQLRQALLDAGLAVVVVAPATNQSGVSRAATYKNPVRAALIESDGGPVYSVSGTPVDCVRLALGGNLVPDAKLVISGINHGANVGDDIYNSGTVGAAIEAALFEVPALALSQQSLPGHFNILDPVGVDTVGYEESTRYGVAVARALLEAPVSNRTVLNVNVPAETATGVTVTRLGKRFYERGSLAPLAQRGPSKYFLVYGASEDGPAPYENVDGTDFAALGDHLVSVSPVTYDHAVHAPSELEQWAQTIVDRTVKYAEES
ncbi:5'/3'-nucleotidase SurE [Rhodococcus koreensis]